MKSREEIAKTVKEVLDDAAKEFPTQPELIIQTLNSVNNCLAVDLLLDIRDLLVDIKQMVKL